MLHHHLPSGSKKRKGGSIVKSDSSYAMVTLAAEGKPHMSEKNKGGYFNSSSGSVSLDAFENNPFFARLGSSSRVLS
jgi:hypothetical protein